MCGIVGYLGGESVTPKLLEGLRRLEYRGYDSAGLATLEDGVIARRRTEGKLENLIARLRSEPLGGVAGIGHTRWATHGRPSEENAHPHAPSGATPEVAVVHNGIIENYKELRTELVAAGTKFSSETDTEVIVFLVQRELQRGATPLEAVQQTLTRLEGAFALAFLFAADENLLIAARRGSPLAVGVDTESASIGSDVLALASMTQKIAYLEEGDLAVLRRGEFVCYGANGESVTRELKSVAQSNVQIGKGEYRHFMRKEIFEQPTAVGETLHSFLDPARLVATFPDLPTNAKDLRRMLSVACGTAFYAAATARYWIEAMTGIVSDVEIASELRYRKAALDDCGLALCVSQSGETMDTLEASRLLAQRGIPRVAIVNNADSTLARESDLSLLTRAGPEIGVASTKAFTTQLTLLACLALTLAEKRQTLETETLRRYAESLMELPSRLFEALELDKKIAQLAHDIAEAQHALYLGRGTLFPIALEGALKLKEISYIHAEGYAGGEMKHGPLALVDEEMPVVVLAPSGGLFAKIASNAEEVLARGGRMLLISDAEGLAAFGGKATWTLELPKVPELTQPILYALPMQLLAYHAALVRGTDVDQPRNLAKSVTVE